MAMESCKLTKLFEAHANAANRWNDSSSKKDKKPQGKGKGKGGGKGLPLHYHYLQPPRQQ